MVISSKENIKIKNIAKGSKLKGLMTTKNWSRQQSSIASGKENYLL
jgi:hypothetical protein